MNLAFTKMQGCGNDYIYINCFEYTIESPEALSVLLSDRYFGVGGDGIILICPSAIADAQMRIFNIDGSEGKMCGNGIRCVAKYLYDNHMVTKKLITVETLSGIKTLMLEVEDNLVTNVTVDMGQAELEPQKIPVNIASELVRNYPIIIDDKEYKITCVSMGNPHCVVFCENILHIDLKEIGPKFENSSLFPEQVNAEFVQVIDEHTIKMRVWERGSGETLACGTGACASVVAAVLNGYCKKGEDIQVILTGGTLMIQYTDKCVLMSGPAEKTFEGFKEIGGSL